MRYLSLFSGIEAASVAWHPLGWQCVGVADIEPFPCTALAHHYPNVPNLGDITKVTEEQIKALGRIDVLVFGSPCQDLSVAGKQKGLAGARSGLFFTAMRIVGWARKHCGLRYALWENVPGAFSSNDGRDFAAVVGEMAGLDTPPVPPKGWGTEGAALGSEAMVEWSTLDAQWFGVAQRRRRVFALADFGDWAGRQPILLEPQSLRGDSAPRREAGEGVAGTLASCAGGGGFPSTDNAIDGYVVPAGDRPVRLIDHDVTATLDASFARLQGCSGQDLNHGHSHLVAFGGNNTSGPIAAAAALNACASASGRICGTLRVNGGSASGSAPMVATHMQVRRLTPRECERLQAFPDDYTAVPVRGKPAADGPRYKALGNSMCVNVMRWIGTRIDAATDFFA